MTPRLGRIVRILVMLQAGVRCNALRIAAEAGVHRRTVFRDFAALRSLGFPISFDTANGCYHLSRGASRPSDQELTQLLSLFRNELEQSSGSDCVTERTESSSKADADEESVKNDQQIWHDLVASEHLFPEILAELISAIEHQQRITLVRSVGLASERQITLQIAEVTFQRHGWMVKGTDDNGAPVELNVDEISECLVAVLPDLDSPR